MSDTTIEPDGARRTAHAAAERADVAVRPMNDVAELAQAEALLARVWRHAPGSVEVDISMLMALARTGHYVVGAFRHDTLVGATVGFRCEPFPVTLYSHVTGVLREAAMSGTGTALKLYQRMWCLERGMTGVRWTFDPLQARNARLNVHRLQARSVQFSPDYYGMLRDGLNADHGSDRLLVHWDLTVFGGRRPDFDAGRTAPAVVQVGAEGEPLCTDVPTATHCRVHIPSDIDALRAHHPELAHRWRATVGAVLAELFERGWQVVDFDTSSAYVLRRPNWLPTTGDS